jgi:hypothetical protein
MEKLIRCSCGWNNTNHVVRNYPGYKCRECRREWNPCPECEAELEITTWGTFGSEGYGSKEECLKCGWPDIRCRYCNASFDSIELHLRHERQCKAEKETKADARKQHVRKQNARKQHGKQHQRKQRDRKQNCTRS